MLVIGLAGKKQYGKSTTANFIKEICPNLSIKEFALAESLKDLVIAGFGIPRECCYGTEEEKNRQLFYWEICSQKLRDKYEKSPMDPLTGRELLQLVGTDLFRENFCGSIWVRLCMNKIKQSDADIAIISDVRFPNELAAVKVAGGKAIKIYRTLNITQSIQHISETALDNTPDACFDYVIQNYGTLEDLKDKTIGILEMENLL